VSVLTELAGIKGKKRIFHNAEFNLMQAGKKFKYVSLEKAYELVRGLAKKVRQEGVWVHQAYNRILAEEITSEVDIPPCSVSHFDGYAVKAEDVAQASIDNPVLLRVVGRSFLGEEFEDEIKTGEAAYISTGCKLPLSANAVVPLELTRAKGGFIEVRRSVQPFENVISAGSNAKKGGKVFSPGHVLRAQDIKFLMDIKKWKVKVFKKPVVAIFSVGNELTNRIEKSDRKKFDSHSIMISHLISEAGGVPLNLGVAFDDIDDIKRLLISGFEKADIIATIGGSSVGERDYVWEAANQIGTPTATIRGIKVHPGRVTSLVMLEKPIIMLPGHVQSTLIGFCLLLLPLIRLMAGFTSPFSFTTLKAKMSRKIPLKEFASFKRVRFVKVTRVNSEYIAEPILGDSSLTSIVVKANGFIMIPEGKETVEEGEEVDVHLVNGLFP
jgi:molybdenum cofactor synthesis domain-containing protein